MSKKDRPLVVKTYGNVHLGRQMRVRDGKYGHIEVAASFEHRRRTKTFPMDTPLMDMLHWQHQTREALRTRGARGKIEDTTLRQDVDTYLASLTPERRARAAIWLSYWVAMLGHLRRDQFTLAIAQRFFATVKPQPRNGVQGAFSGSSKNKLRTYLIAVWRHLDGRTHGCPVLDVPVFDERNERPREIAPEVVLQILAEMPDGKNRARLGLLFTTGMRPGEMVALTREDFVLAADPPYIHVPSAKGGRTRMMTLPTIGREYAQAFLDHQAFGPAQNLVRDMVRAAKRAGIEPYAADPHPCGRKRLLITPYALRHAYAMNMRRAGAGIDDIADALGHRALQTTRRYAGPIPSRQQALVDRMWEGVGT